MTISVGHCNERVNARVHEQMDRLQHVSTVFATEPQAALAAEDRVADAGRRLTKSFFTNSGTEANETAILAARCYTGASEIIALRHSYHGRSSLTMALTGNAAGGSAARCSRASCTRTTPTAIAAPSASTYPACGVRCARDVEELIKTATSGRVAGFIAEPMQGVGGFITPPREYFEIVAGIVRKHGGIFISDEVQTGWGRTGGKWFGIEQYGVAPDVITSAKGLGNGIPSGSPWPRPRSPTALKGLTISTFGGNPVATTAAKAVIDFIEEEKLARERRQRRAATSAKSSKS